MQTITIVSMFMDEDNCLHVQWQVKGGLFYEQSIIAFA